MATETVSANSKKKTQAVAAEKAPTPKADALAKASEFETSTQVQLREEEFVEVDFNRIWYRTKKGQNPVSFLPIARSGDMRGTFKSKYPNDKSPCHMYACELMHDVLASDQTLFSGEEPIAASRGEVFFLIEPKRCAGKLQEAFKRGYVCRMQSTEKVEVKSREFGVVHAWDYKLSIRPIVTVTVVDADALMMPTGRELEAVEVED